MVEAFDLLLRDLMETNTLFGGKIVVLVLSKNMRATKDPEFCDYLMRMKYLSRFIHILYKNFAYYCAILTTKNDFVDEINDMLISQFPNTENLPPYKLTLKKNCPIMLLRNLNPVKVYAMGHA
ncbi:hypothetical protein H5410_058631 [Solanum commersonii]|uniref:ATP-dependent DNA helicase n=1 Tax=Solanum commersonii TaxID=4109 RepID=A0A9J5WRN5_SOLCO|nr:hypothetical protein H5410_058631 [Solanum commersonii]